MGRPKGSKNKSKGLGDTIEKVTKATGIDKVVKFVAGEDCGCEERKEYLNKKFSYPVKKCFTEEQYKKWGTLRKQIKNNLDKHQQQLIHDLSLDVFGRGLIDPKCTDCNAVKFKDTINKFNIMYDSYE